MNRVQTPERENRNLSRKKSTNESSIRKSRKLSENVNPTLENKIDVCCTTPPKNSKSAIKSTNTPKINHKNNSTEFKSPNEIFQLQELKLNIKRVDKTNYISIFSPSAKKIIENARKNSPSEMENKLATPKRSTRKSSRWNQRNEFDVDELIDKILDDENSEDDIFKTPKKNSRKSSVSSIKKLVSSVNNSMEPITPKRVRKPVMRFGENVDLEKIDLDETIPKSKRKNSTMIDDEAKDVDFEIDIWKTPVNKRIRQSMTPTNSGSKTRRKILEDIPENDLISTPKTPKKTPKAYVKSLRASASKRLDSGARVPCSPLEKARANLHLHAAPKHLPCRESEFKSIRSFLARKINDDLTGCMYVSGVPGTGKTATVKRVIDSLSSDLMMKHSFKFIEINGLRLANPHQAFSVIWKELTSQNVSSARAQALLNDYFSGNETREVTTILLVDEVDHICNRKQDVVYNILDWPTQIGSKVVVIAIANTMDLPERVLRGCVTSRMGLTRLVFKPYTFQQLQEIIMNRLIGNSSFDPDAVQLVSRKVAAVSGDARRALDICRRAIDLIKSEDESQMITINHVNQVINSILSGLRVTAIRQCSLFEQYFLRALRDETVRTGFDHSTIDSVYTQMKNICLLEGEELPNDQQIIMMTYRLRDNGLIFLEKKQWDVFRKVSLNVSPEDISYALDKYNQ
ncbi:origin recognition complex subunit 1 isoform X2 [Daktulosphaira vitifoliae]|uniref:origin recognition complex subunit 1 isoform X2 n=1 Tax=Daktulosphaira vitifoliae TaxID=58002 RepID=UPI0021A9CE45|nr:origin recognition complex subunit 1 isoform X2 [Daktulosphaira vitifoliae]